MFCLTKKALLQLSEMDAWIFIKKEIYKNMQSQIKQSIGFGNAVNMPVVGTPSHFTISRYEKISIEELRIIRQLYRSLSHKYSSDLSHNLDFLARVSDLAYVLDLYQFKPISEIPKHNTYFHTYKKTVEFFAGKTVFKIPYTNRRKKDDPPMFYPMCIDGTIAGVKHRSSNIVFPFSDFFFKEPIDPKFTEGMDELKIRELILSLDKLRNA